MIAFASATLLAATLRGVTLVRLCRRARATAGAIAAALVAAALPAAANEYAVSPMRLELDAATRSAAVTLRNLGKEPIDFQIQVREWTQDAKGKDVYVDTNELVFFPKILTVLPDEERIVRVGMKDVPTRVERTFRIFIERMPAPAREPPKPGAQVAVNLRFALPVFVKPPSAQPQGAIESAALERGTLRLVLRNSGNAHFRMDDGVALTGRDSGGAEVFSATLPDRYLLAGTVKEIAAPIPKAACTQLATLDVVAAAEQFTLRRTLDVGRASCE